MAADGTAAPPAAGELKVASGYGPDDDYGIDDVDDGEHDNVDDQDFGNDSDNECGYVCADDYHHDYD